MMESAAREIYPEITFDAVRSQPVRKKAAKKASFEFANFIMVLVFLGLAAFVHVYQQALVAQNGIDIAKLKAEIQEESRVGKRLKVEKMLLESPSRLERMATDKLGMVEPDHVNYIVLPPKQVAAAAADPRNKSGPGGLLARIGLLAGNR